MKTICSNVIKPGGTITDPAWVDPGDGSVSPRIPCTKYSISSIWEQQLTITAYGASIYNFIGRDIDPDGLTRCCP